MVQYFSHYACALVSIKIQIARLILIASVTELFLSEEDVERIHDFEEECVEDYYRDKEQRIQCSTEERIRLTHER